MKIDIVKQKPIVRATVALLVLTLIFAAVFSSALLSFGSQGAVYKAAQTYLPDAVYAKDQYGDAAFESSQDTAGVAGTYDGVSSDSLWYYGDGGIKLDEIKNEVNGWNKSAYDKNNPLVIAVIDTGVNAAHPMLSQVLLKDKNGKVLGYNSHENTNNFNDDDLAFHGTAVAGIIAMAVLELGLQDFVKIYPIKASYVDTKDKNVSKFKVDAVSAALEKLNDGGIPNVVTVNLSIGLFKSDMTSVHWDTNERLLGAIKNVSRFANVVAAAGNGKNGSGVDSASASNKYYPALCEGVISVMAYGESGLRLKSSNYGSDYDLIAPGGDIYTAGGGTSYQTVNGTSMSSPFVALTSVLMRMKSLSENKNNSSNKVLDATKISLILRNKNDGSDKITEVNRVFKKLTVNYLLTRTQASIPYVQPDKILINTGNFTDKDGKDDLFTVKIDGTAPLHLSANLYPFGDTDPELDKLIEWWQISEDGINETLLGRGRTLTYIPSYRGFYTIEARLNYGKEIIAGISVCAVNNAFLGGEVRVTYASDANKSVDEAPSNIKVYCKEKVLLGLTGMKYVDPEKEVKWFVNEKYVGSGLTYLFNPQKTGHYVITAEYNGQRLAHDYSLVMDVDALLMKPINLASVIVSIIVVCAIGVVVTLVLIKKQKAKENQ